MKDASYFSSYKWPYCVFSYPLLPSRNVLQPCQPTVHVARNVGESLIFFGAAFLLLFCLLSLSSLLSTLSLSLSLSSSSSSHNIAETDLCSCKRLIFLAGDLFLRLSGSRVQL